jgi:hypothetical protein
MNVTAVFGLSRAGGNRVFMRVFASARMRGASKIAEPQPGPAAKSRNQAHGAKCKKSLSSNIFGAANESLI